MVTDDKFILDEEGNPVPERDLLTWAKWFQEAGPKRILAKDLITFKDKETGDDRYISVSTIFLGLDHSMGRTEKPLIWDTMTFGSEEDEVQYRYADRQEALDGHNEVVASLNKKYGIETATKTETEGAEAGSMAQG